MIDEIRACCHCEADLPHGPRPILAASEQARLLIIGQAPGIRVHESGIPWDDPSGKRLRQWLGINDSNFYDSTKVAIVPMGFCYPGPEARAICRRARNVPLCGMIVCSLNCQTFD
jgi:uracil-DNA glycosylase